MSRADPRALDSHSHLTAILSSPHDTADRRDHFVGQLDWISGFVAGRSGLEVELVLTPLHRHLEFDDRGKLVSYAGERVAVQVHKRCPLWAISRFGLESHLLRERVPRAKGVVVRTDRYAKYLERLNGFPDDVYRSVPQTSLPYVTRMVHVEDATTAVRTYSELQQEMPDVAEIIAERAPCPSHVGFFVSKHGKRTTVIPTSEVLRTCYNPTLELLESLISDGPKAALSASLTFNGLMLRPERVTSYPFRMARSDGLAEFELQQLMPRACAYANSHRGKLPILIRPPFRGRVAISGNALIQRRNGRSIILFAVVRLLETPLQYLTRRRPRLDFGERHFGFAPFLWGCKFGSLIELPSLKASARDDTIKNAERYEVRFFTAESRKLERGYTWKKSWHRWQTLLYPGTELDS